MLDASPRPGPRGPAEIDGHLADLAGPVLVVSSRAGLGNHSVGAELARRIGAGRPVEHLPIEHLLPAELVRSDFDRHRWICLHAPWLLGLIGTLPFSYQLKRRRESAEATPSTRALGERLRARGARTIIAVNNRAAFWVGALRRHGALDAALWAVLTDYAVGMGWRYQFWPAIDRAFGVVPPGEVPREALARYQQVAMPVRPGYGRIAADPGAPDHVLVTGGGWGLGPVAEVSMELARHLPWVHQHVLCGDNLRLLRRVEAIAQRHPGVRAYPAVEAPEEVMARCASVITKPGGLTLAEAHAAGRSIFLLGGLPGVEQKNRAFALRHMNGREYSLEAFQTWVAGAASGGGSRRDA